MKKLLGLTLNCTRLSLLPCATTRSNNANRRCFTHLVLRAEGDKMKYMGSKNRIAKYILPIMLESRTKGMTWVEPFVGGANMIDKVDGERIGADLNKYLIEALLTIRDSINDIPKSNKDFS